METETETQAEAETETEMGDVFLSPTGRWKGWRDGLVDRWETDGLEQASDDHYPAPLPQEPFFMVFRFLTGTCIIRHNSTNVLLRANPWRDAACLSSVTDLLSFDRMSSETEAARRRRRGRNGRADHSLLLPALVSFIYGPLTEDQNQQRPFQSIQKHQ